MIHTTVINGWRVKTGDLICTINGTSSIFFGLFWKGLGALIPGEIDHIAIYTGPGTRCVEAGAKLKVITFNVPGGKWVADKMVRRRGHIYDTFKGIAYPLAGKILSPEREKVIREKVAKYCLKQAKLGKAYNFNFFDSETTKAFYCSQLAYKAYKPHGINLNTGKGILKFPLTKSVIFPQEIWAGCVNKKQKY